MPITNPSAIAMIPTDRAMMAFTRQFLGEEVVEGRMDPWYASCDRRSNSATGIAGAYRW